jgi:glycerophosphoryl diester phosphodiesterase
MASLEAVLALLPAETGVNIQLKYAREFDAKYESVGRSGEVNAFVDSVLHVVYEAGKTSPGRKIIFSSFDPTVCTALNWKQPNCKSPPVFIPYPADTQMRYSSPHIAVFPGRERMHRSFQLD